MFEVKSHVVPETEPLAPRAAHLRYGWAVVSVALAVAAERLLHPLVDDKQAFATFIIAVVFSAWYGGFGPALTALLLGTVATCIVLTPSGVTLGFDRSVGLPGLAAYFFVGLSTAIFSQARRKAQRLAEAKALEARHVEEALRESEERFQALANSAPVLIWMSGRDQLASWFNKPWLDFRGRPLDLEIGSGWTEGVHPEDRERLLQTYAAAFEARRDFLFECRLRREDGAYRWMLVSGTPRYSPGEEFAGYIGTCVDFSERKWTEEGRNDLLASERAARSEAERASRIKDEFLATLFHELRTPLQSMLGWATLLSRRDMDEVCRQGIEAIDRNARLQVRLIEDLLDISRIISGKVHLDLQRVEPRSVMEAAIESLRSDAQAREIDLVAELDPLAGPVFGDPGRLQQVAWNLLSNAIKFTPPGGRVTVRLERTGPWVQLTVSDTGQGINPASLPQVFEGFQQADPTSARRNEGLGLGLTIVRELVELHGGAVRASSAGEGKGARFDVTLPLVPARPAGPESSGEVPGAAGQGLPLPTTLRGLRVLVVDDDRDTRRLIRRILEDYEAEVVTASTATEALDAIGHHRPGILISDIGMAGEDGYSLIQKIRSREADQGGAMPALALTAFASPEDRTKAMVSGFQMHLSKPVEPWELVGVVAQLASLTGGRSGGTLRSPPLDAASDGQTPE